MQVPGELEWALRGYQWTRATEGMSGGEVWRLTDRTNAVLYLKCGTERIGEAIAAEMIRLRWLSKYVAAPQIRQFVCSAEGSWLLTSALPGVSAYEFLSSASGSQQLDCVASMARFLRALHAIPVDECPFDSDHLFRLTEARRNLLAGEVDESDFGSMHEGWTAQQVWDKLTALLPLPPAAVVVTHGDFSLDNVFVDLEGNVTGCIDTGLAGKADAYQDLAILYDNLEEFGPASQRRLFSAYGIDAPDLRRIEFHLCLDEFF
jgi:aminoglycoside 3'-phosphotransferase I